jgi:hypothetical protein
MNRPDFDSKFENPKMHSRQRRGGAFMFAAAASSDGSDFQKKLADTQIRLNSHKQNARRMNAFKNIAKERQTWAQTQQAEQRRRQEWEAEIQRLTQLEQKIIADRKDKQAKLFFNEVSTLTGVFFTWFVV